MDKLIDISNTPAEQCKHWADKKCWNLKVTMGKNEEHTCPFTISKRHTCLEFRRYLR